jgi:hypothetical protein
MKTKKTLKSKYLDLDVFEALFLEFLNMPTWTQEKYEARDVLYGYLESKKVTSIRVKPKSKYNYCTYTHTFTIIRVPLTVRGKLAPFKGELALIRCSSFKGAWTQYINEVFLLDKTLTESDHQRLKQLFGYYYIKNDSL